MTSCNKDSLFIANRGDGLGERIRTLLNSMVLADKTKGRFVFTWPSTFSESSFHAIGSVDSVFSDDFISDHFKERKDIAHYDLKPLREISSFSNINQHNLGIVLGHNNLKHQLKDKSLQPQDIYIEYRKAFEKIGFSAQVFDAINLANSVDFEKNVVAIHLRTGDVVYEKYRFMDYYYSKTVPFYVLDSLIQYYKRLGKDIMLFSLDTEAINFFKRKYGVKISSDFGDDSFDDVQKALFDIVLMSRCSDIICGSSGFAIVASWIGGSKISGYRDILSNEEIKLSFDSSKNFTNGFLCSDSIPPLLRAFSIAHYVQSYSDSLPKQDRLKLLINSLDLDPENNFYRLLISLIYYELDNDSEAEKMLMQVVNSTSPYGIDWMARTKFPHGRVLDQFVRDLKIYAGRGNLVAGYVGLLGEKHSSENKVDKSFYQDILDKANKSSPIFKSIESALSTLN